MPLSSLSTIVRDLHQILPAMGWGCLHTSGRCPDDHTQVTMLQPPRVLSRLRLFLQGMTPS